MKINLKESKDILPVSFLTNFVSDGWDKIGLLKDQLEGIKKEFKGTKKVEELIQALIDAYLVCIGQMEQHLADKDYLDIEDKEEGLKESLKDGKVDSHELEIIDKLIDKFRNEYKLEGKELYDACIKAGMTKEEVNAFVISDDEVKENLKEDVNINIEKVVINEPEVSDVEIEHENESEKIPAVNVPTEDIVIDGPAAEKSLADKVSEIEASCKETDKKDTKSSEDDKFEYFVDEFPEPVPEISKDDED